MAKGFGHGLGMDARPISLPGGGGSFRCRRPAPRIETRYRHLMGDPGEAISPAANQPFAYRRMRLSLPGPLPAHEIAPASRPRQRGQLPGFGRFPEPHPGPL